jgi:hypothetical protein
VSVGTSIVPPGPCPPPADTPGLSTVITPPQVTASIHDFAASLATQPPRSAKASLCSGPRSSDQCSAPETALHESWTIQTGYDGTGTGNRTGARASDSLTGNRSDMPEQAWHRAAPRSGRLSGMIKRVNRYEPTCYRLILLHGVHDHALRARAAPDGGYVRRAQHAGPAATVRDGIREVVGSDCGRHREHPGASTSAAWMPMGRSCQQPAFAVSDVRRSRRMARNSGRRRDHPPGRASPGSRAPNAPARDVRRYPFTVGSFPVSWGPVFRVSSSSTRCAARLGDHGCDQDSSERAGRGETG